MIRIEEFILLKRLLIIFGSICFLWFIIGFIFLSIQTYKHFKKKTNQKFFISNQDFQIPSQLLNPIQQTFKQDQLSDNEDDDQLSVLTSVSSLSNRTKIHQYHRHYTTKYQGITEEPLDLIYSNLSGISNLGYSRSTLTSSSDIDTSLYYPAYRNFAYSQSTLCSTDDINSHQKTPTPSLILPLTNYSSPSSIDQFNFKRQSSRSSTNTISSEFTNATYLSCQSSIKPTQLPIVMITDVDRLQTDIIELENFEPEKEWNHSKYPLKYFLNSRITKEN